MRLQRHDNAPPDRPGSRRSAGESIEDLVAAMLAEHGLRVLERRFRAYRGEVDIIGEHGAALVFIEVRSRRSDSPVTPSESVNRRKRRRIAAAAHEYMARHGIEEREVRFDVAEVTTAPDGRPLTVNWRRNLFDLDDL